MCLKYCVKWGKKLTNGGNNGRVLVEVEHWNMYEEGEERMEVENMAGQQ